MSREYTQEEVLNQFIDGVLGSVEYWIAEDRAPTLREKMEGLAFSFCTMLDGSRVDMPMFIVAPMPHESDKDFHIENNENYYPENYIHAKDVKCDIGGWLHDTFSARCRERDQQGSDNEGNSIN